MVRVQKKSLEITALQDTNLVIVFFTENIFRMFLNFVFDLRTIFSVNLQFLQIVQENGYDRDEPRF